MPSSILGLATMKIYLVHYLLESSNGQTFDRSYMFPSHQWESFGNAPADRVYGCQRHLQAVHGVLGCTVLGISEVP